MKETAREVVVNQAYRSHNTVIAKFFKSRQDWTTSNLGKMLFKYEKTLDSTAQNRTYVVLVWKHWKWLKARHVSNFGSSEKDPLNDCSVNNCIFTGDDDKLDTADAVVIHLQHGLIPQVKQRNQQQRWIFLNDESPKHTFSLAKKKLKLKDFANVFNWSMTYRSDADIPVPYGRTVAFDEPVFKNIDFEDITNIIPNWKKKRRDVLVTALISNCVKYRMDFITELQKYIPVDIYGKCSNNETNRNRCPGHFKSDCEPISEYLFYLVLENSNCREYFSEKIWFHAFSKGAIPIIMGVSRSDCKNLLPPNSYFYIPMSTIQNATEMKAVASNIVFVSQNEEYLRTLHYWRNNFAAVNEHGYFGTKSYHWCRVCEALNYNDDTEKMYNERHLKWFLDPKLLCE
ncbi:unnamed protein product [Arctia plantaginis]|uniref:Fucosyltransferase n=1 Tax=Arctia plantaginis TaxID=874455 RepID=A0A8S0ZA54_ARCPL|nr:unnamed protein product [Arctia plantaginis]